MAEKEYKRKQDKEILDSSEEVPMGVPKVQRLWLNNLRNSRNSLARLMREYHRLDIPPAARDDTRYKMLFYAFSILLQFHKAETDEKYLETLINVEAMLSRGAPRSV